MSEDIVFHNKGGRPKELTAKEAYEAKLEAKRRWRKKNKDRISLYNEMYREAERKGRKKSKRKRSRKRSSSIHSKNKRKRSNSIHSKKRSNSRRRRSKRSKSKRKHKSRRKRSRNYKLQEGGIYGGHKVTLLKVNPDGSRIVLIQ